MSGLPGAYLALAKSLSINHGILELGMTRDAYGEPIKEPSRKLRCNTLGSVIGCLTVIQDEPVGRIDKRIRSR